MARYAYMKPLTSTDWRKEYADGPLHAACCWFMLASDSADGNQVPVEEIQRTLYAHYSYQKMPAPLYVFVGASSLSAYIDNDGCKRFRKNRNALGGHLFRLL